MGSYCSLKVQNIELLWNKSDVIGMELFRPSDKQIIPPRSEDERQICQYSAPASVVIDRIMAMGHRIDEAKIGLTSYLEDLKSSYLALYDIPERKPSAKAVELIENFTFEKWQQTLRSLLTKEQDDDLREKIYDPAYEIETEIDVVFNDFIDQNFFGTNAAYLPVILAILELVEDKVKTHVILDYSDLVDGGYFEKEDELCKDIHFEKTVILTEGVSDKKFIQRSLKALYPHIADCYSFLDFHELRLAGSANSLVHTIKAFSAAGIKNKIIAIFDNDTAARVSKRVLDGLPVAKNIRVIMLPDLAFLNNYPTKGPQGLHVMNVNGLAGSIELYFEESVLKEPDGSFIPVIWKGFDESVQQYQGEISKKSEVQSKFEKILDNIENGEPASAYKLESMKTALETICGFKISATVSG